MIHGLFLKKRMSDVVIRSTCIGRFRIKSSVIFTARDRRNENAAESGSRSSSLASLASGHIISGISTISNVRRGIADVAVQTERKDWPDASRSDQLFRRMRTCYHDMAIWITSGPGLCRMLPMPEVRGPRLAGPPSVVVANGLPFYSRPLATDGRLFPRLSPRSLVVLALRT